MSVKTQLKEALDTYIDNFKATHGHNPMTYIDPQSPSPAAIVGTEQDELVQWQVFTRPEGDSITDLGNALEVDFPAQLHELFCSFFSGNLIAKVDGHDIELLLPWNDDDFVHLQQNITGHVLMKRRLKQADTVFIGLTDQEDLLLSVRVSDGAVCLEYVGKEPHHVLAQDISEFLGLLMIP
ncbi:SecY-interacting protein [Pseudoalteromonas sp. SSDWG2]|uniref:SecY-interacting protein n=1 Tax=Pseudoalteromonas sp. SSDWG2 TaxID=3139391 RepID=UPI003BA9DF58